jgi:hypothetical protein
MAGALHGLRPEDAAAESVEQAAESATQVEPRAAPVDTLLRLQRTVGNHAVSALVAGGMSRTDVRSLARMPGGKTTLDAVERVNGTLQQKIKTENIGYFTVKTSIQKHCLDFYKTGARIETPPSGLVGGGRNTIALLSTADFEKGFMEYVQKIANALSTDGDDLEARDPRHEYDTSVGLKFGSDSAKGSHTIHSYPVGGVVQTLTDEDFGCFKDLAFVLYADPNDVVLEAALGRIIESRIAALASLLGKSKGDFDTAVKAIKGAAASRRAATSAEKQREAASQPKPAKSPATDVSEEEDLGLGLLNA